MNPDGQTIAQTVDTFVEALANEGWRFSSSKASASRTCTRYRLKVGNNYLEKTPLYKSPPLLLRLKGTIFLRHDEK